MLFSSDNKDVWDVVQQVRQEHEDILVLFFHVVKEEYIKKDHSMNLELAFWANVIVRL